MAISLGSVVLSITLKVDISFLFGFLNLVLQLSSVFNVVSNDDNTSNSCLNQTDIINDLIDLLIRNFIYVFYDLVSRCVSSCFDRLNSKECYQHDIDETNDVKVDPR